ALLGRPNKTGRNASLRREDRMAKIAHMLALGLLMSSSGQALATTLAPAAQTDAVHPKSGEQARPSIAIILLDDVGFAASSVFGGPVNMPGLAALAEQGAR